MPWQSHSTPIPLDTWHKLDDGRIQCDLCPRFCRLHEGQRAFCFVRARQPEKSDLILIWRKPDFLA
jgi:pyruvate formate lyase activating enzyme